MSQTILNLGLFILDVQFIQRIANRMLEFIEAIGLPEYIVSAQAHGFGNLADGCLATQHDYRCLYFLIPDKG